MGGARPTNYRNSIALSTKATRRGFSNLLSDAYGYTVTLPSTLDTAQVSLDSITGTLLVQGVRDANDNAQNETFAIDRVTDGAGDDIRVTITRGGDTFTERVPYADLTDILIHENGGNDNITVNANVEQPWQLLDYVVSSNEDAIEATGVGDGVVDLNAVVPGNQTTLRGAIRDANAQAGADAIYAGRGTYDLTLISGGTTSGSLDITSDMPIIGAGAGLTVIDATAVNDRVFLV